MGGRGRARAGVSRGGRARAARRPAIGPRPSRLRSGPGRCGTRVDLVLREVLGQPGTSKRGRATLPGAGSLEKQHGLRSICVVQH